MSKQTSLSTCPPPVRNTSWVFGGNESARRPDDGWKTLFKSQADQKQPIKKCVCVGGSIQMSSMSGSAEPWGADVSVKSQNVSGGDGLRRVQVIAEPRGPAGSVFQHRIFASGRAGRPVLGAHQNVDHPVGRTSDFSLRGDSWLSVWSKCSAKFSQQ